VLGFVRAGQGHSAGEAQRQLSAPQFLLLAALAAAVIEQGGFYLDSRIIVGVLLTAAFAFEAFGKSGGRHQAPLVPSALAAMAAWALLSAAVAGHTLESLATISTLAGVGAVVVIVARASRPQRDQLVSGVIAIGAIAALSGWIGVVFRISPWASLESGLWRAATTITYTNAAAAVMAPVALLALARLVARPTVFDRLAAVLLVVGVVATLSRFGIVGLGLGYVAIACLLGVRRTAVATARTVGGATIAALSLTVTMAVHSPSRMAVALGGLALGLVFAVAPIRLRRRAAWALLAVAVAAVTLVAGWHRLGTVSSAWNQRTSAASPSRTEERQAALTLISHHLMTGVGPGRATFLWTTPDRHLRVDRYAHNEYLQLAAEEGLPSLLLLGALVAALLATARRGSGISRADPNARALWVGAVVGLVYFAGHSGFDFLWHIPAVPLLAAVLVGLSTSPSDTKPK
jgi:hypothetical protein